MSMHVHPDGTIDAQPCTGCGESTLSIVELAVSADAARGRVPDGTVVYEIFFCRSCQGPAEAEAEALRAVFDALISGGMDRTLANRVMIAWHLPRRT